MEKCPVPYRKFATLTGMKILTFGFSEILLLELKKEEPELFDEAHIAEITRW